MSGENPKVGASENGANKWDMTPPSAENNEVADRDAEYYRNHPGEINNLVAELIQLRGGADSTKEGTWDKDARAYVGDDGMPRDWAHLTGYLKRNPDALDAIMNEYNNLKNPAEEDDAVAAEGGEDNAESAEAKEHDRLATAVYKHDFTEIWGAARATGIELKNIRDIRDFFPNEDIQKLLDYMDRDVDDGSSAAEPEPVVAPAAAEASAATKAPAEEAVEAVVDPAVAEGVITSEEIPNALKPSEVIIAPDGTETVVDDNNEIDVAEGGADENENKEEEKRVGLFRKIGNRIGNFISKHKNGILIGSLALLLTATMASHFSPKMLDQYKDKNLNQGDKIEQQYDGGGAIENMESQGIIDGYGEKGMWLSEGKTGRYNYAAADEVAEAAKSDDARDMMMYTAKNQSESFADYMTSLPDSLRPDSLKGIDNILDMEDAIEGLSVDQYQEAMKAFEDAMGNATVEDIELNGEYDNAYMRLQDSDGDVVHENMELVRCTTTENGTHAKRIILHDKEGNEVGDMIVKAYTGQNGKKGCMQIVRRKGAPELIVLTEIPANPDHPDEPDVPTTPDKPDKPTTPDKPDKPTTPDKPDKPTTPDQPDQPDQPQLTPKNPEAAENMQPGGNGSTNEVKPADAPQKDLTERPDSTPHKNVEVAPGTGDADGDHVVDSTDTQTGRHDTSLESDYGGGTIDEAVENADVSTVTDGGEVVAEQENRTTEDAAAQEQRQEAAAAEAAVIEEQAPAQEAAAAAEEEHANDTAEQQAQRAEDAMADILNGN